MSQAKDDVIVTKIHANVKGHSNQVKMARFM